MLISKGKEETPSMSMLEVNGERYVDGTRPIRANSAGCAVRRR